MNKDELLKEAKIRYPPGTVFKSSRKEKGFTIVNSRFYYSDGYTNDKLKAIYLNPSSLKENASGRWSVYLDGKWAEIISKPKEESKDALLEEAKRRYPVGTTFISVLSKCDCTVREGFISNDANYVYNDHHAVYSFNKGVWAEIMSSPKEEFVVGKWYKYKPDYYIKVTFVQKEEKYTEIHYDSTIKKGSYNCENDYMANNNLEKYMLKYGPVPIEEIQQYLPKGHADLIEKKEEYKVGDWVTITGSRKGGWLQELDISTFEITKKPTKYSGGIYYSIISYCRKHRGGLYPSFREATPEEIAEQVTGKKELDKDALLTEAKRRYPVGTEYKSVLGNNRRITEGQFYIGEGYIYGDNNVVYEFSTKKWAEIISTPKEEATPIEDSVPEYVECTEESYSGGYSAGKIYKVRSSNSFVIYTEIDDKGSKTNNWGKENFKPSTKEAYSKQEYDKQEEGVLKGIEELRERSLRNILMRDSEVHWASHPKLVSSLYFGGYDPFISTSEPKKKKSLFKSAISVNADMEVNLNLKKK